MHGCDVLLERASVQSTRSHITHTRVYARTLIEIDSKLTFQIINRLFDLATYLTNAYYGNYA